jgi:hypothetical protein
MKVKEIGKFVLHICLSVVGRAVGGLDEEVWIGSSTANIVADTSHFSLKID